MYVRMYVRTEYTKNVYTIQERKKSVLKENWIDLVLKIYTDFSFIKIWIHFLVDTVYKIYMIRL